MPANFITELVPFSCISSYPSKRFLPTNLSDYLLNINSILIITLHFCKSNPDTAYGMALKNVVEQGNLGIQVHSSLKMMAHVGEVEKAFGRLAIGSKGIECGRWKSLLQLSGHW